MTGAPTSVAVELYLFGLFLVHFKGYGITASAVNYVFPIFKMTSCFRYNLHLHIRSNSSH